MRADHRLAQTPLLGRTGRQRRGKIPAAGAFVADRCRFAARADRPYEALDQGTQFDAETLAGRGQKFTRRNERSIVGGKLAAAVGALLEEEVARTQRPFVGA